jgi:hypothetical protein
LTVVAEHSLPLRSRAQLLDEHGRARGDFRERIGLAVVVDPSHQAVEVLSSAQNRHQTLTARLVAPGWPTLAWVIQGGTTWFAYLTKGCRCLMRAPVFMA